LVEDIAEFVEPVPLLARLRPHVPYRYPEAERPVAHGDDGRSHAPTLQVPEYGLPTLRALPIAVVDRDQLLRPVGPDADHPKSAEAVVLQADIKVHAIDPDGHVVAVGEAALLEVAVVGLPLVGQPRDVGGRQPGSIVPEQRRERLAEVASGQAAQIEYG